MLVNCPKCGFSQPKDRYCASCGVDMDVFTPKKPSFLKTFLGNPYVHVLSVLLIVGVSAFLVRQHMQQQEGNSQQQENSGMMILGKAPADSQESAQPTQVNEEIPAPIAATSTAMAVATNESPSSSVPEATEERGGRLGSGVLHTYLLEVDSTIIKSWQEELNAKGNLVRLSETEFASPITDVATKLKAKGVKIVDQLRKEIDIANPSYQLFRGTHRTEDAEQEQGLSFYWMIQEWTDTGIKTDLEISRGFREESSSIKRKSYPLSIELSTSSAYIIAGLLPSKVILNAADETGADPLMQLFKSKDFQARKTDSVLLLSFDSSTPKSE